MPPHELPRLARSVGRPRGGCFWLEPWTTPTIPQTPSIANRCRRIWFLSVMHDHRPVARWRPPRSTYLLRGQRTELEAQRRRLPLQRFQHIGLHLGLVLFHRLRDILLAVLEHPVDQTRQLVRGRFDCSASADPTADAAVEQAQRRHGPAHRLRTHPHARWSLGGCPCDGRDVSSSGCSHPAADTAAANWRSVSRWESD